MNGLAPIVFGVGLQDGLNPCIFMACAALIIGSLWLRSRSLPVFWFCLVFLMVYASGALVFNFGPAQILILQDYFILFAKIFYFILGIGALALGILFLRDWYLLSRHLPAAIGLDKKVRSFKSAGFVVLLLTIIIAVVLSAMSSLWPINTYFMLLGNEAIVKGQWHMVISLLVGYILSSMWPLWLLWAFISIKNLRPSLLRIICAAILFTASTTVIFIFK